MATIRNWLIGFYIVEYEQNGSDRAQYGKRLLKSLEESVNEKGLTATLFYHAREFYKDYPQVKEYLTNTISPTLSVKSNNQISPTASAILSEASYYRENEMNNGDNPPVGILLCTRKGKEMVEYALAGMDNKLFVSTYQLQLPQKETLENFLKNQECLE